MVWIIALRTALKILHMKSVTYLVVCLSFFCLSTALKSQDKWTFKKEKDGVQVFVRNSRKGNIKEIKTIITVRSSLAGAVKMIRDVENYPNWVYKCRKGSMVEYISAKEFYFYNHSDFPWPLRDRDLIFRCTTYQDTTNLTVYSMSSSTPEKLPMADGLIRVDRAHSNWTFTPLENGYIEVVYHLLVDPGGSIPDWMVNFALDIGPVHSMIRFKETVETAPYKHFRYSFLMEPADLIKPNG